MFFCSHREIDGVAGDNVTGMDGRCVSCGRRMIYGRIDGQLWDWRPAPRRRIIGVDLLLTFTAVVAGFVMAIAIVWWGWR